ncbi:MAG: hypothetical protein IGQ45_10505 [Cyanobacterium sp. T60_A2020_053]|nr:hypothetical protein [Cyanobacterium sp. T60_A2020_053]
MRFGQTSGPNNPNPVATNLFEIGANESYEQITRDQQVFRVLSGEVVFDLGGTMQEAQEGDYLYVDAGQMFTITGTAETAELIQFSIASNVSRGEVVVGGSAGNDDIDSAFPTNAFTGNAQILFTGSGLDSVDVSQQGQGSRIDTGSGDDTLFAGTNNRIILGDGDDKLFISTSGGGNPITGGEGADEFWLYTDEGAIPDNPNIISDFVSGLDVIGFLNTTLSLGSSDFSYEQDGSDVIISAFGQEIATLLNTTVTDTDFVFA